MKTSQILVVARWINGHLIARSKLLLAYALAGFIALSMPIAALGDECAEKDNTKAAIECLENKIENKFASIGPKIRVLAAIRVQDGSKVSGTDDVTYDSSSGIVTFSNPRNLPFIPVISNFKNSHYITNTHFVREMVASNKFKVWQTTLGTDDRQSKPTSFTAIVIGY